MPRRHLTLAALLLPACAAADAMSRGAWNFGMITVPQNSVCVVEQLGRFDSILQQGLHFCYPWPISALRLIEMRERPFEVQRVPAITRDNVDMFLDAVVYLRIVDPYKAMYAVSDPVMAMLILAQTTLRSKIGEMTLDETFKHRTELNAHIVSELDRVGKDWGIDCTRFEVRDIEPPASIMQAMKAEAEAERKKRAVILESEGVRQAAINRAEGDKRAAVLASEAQRETTVNVALGEADAARAAAQAKADATEEVARALRSNGGEEAARLGLASEYVAAFGELGRRSSTLVVPTDVASVSGVVGSALAAFETIGGKQQRGAKGP